MPYRLRFAPSPTGYLHPGNARTALLNYLMVRKHKGTLLLRLDDTDTARSKPEFVDAIKEDLTWLGIQWDDTDCQSAHMADYMATKTTLVSSGHLYPCYETPEELEIMRKTLLARGKPPLYNRRALELSAPEIATYKAEGRIPHWRFKLNRLPVTWEDAVRGTITLDTQHISDPVMIRESGDPTYLLCTAVDDIRHSITHIFRGEDHVTNTAINIQLLEALGADPSAFSFAHFPLISGALGEGFSKRDGSLSLRSLRAEGYEPMAINSVLGTIGTSDAMQVFTDMATLASQFDLSHFGRSTAKFDKANVTLINKKIVHGLSFAEAKKHLVAYPAVDEDFWERTKANLDKISDIKHWVDSCLGTITPCISDSDFLKTAHDLLPPVGWDEETWDTWVMHLKKHTQRKGKDLFMPIRLALTGEEHGPELKNMFLLIGRKKVSERLMGLRA
ncbi:MAG: glutamate--tRNA ligase [Alphaproteobacteria bacterium]|nr:MAG: glutamate--tRNA ligase [Alphaproteobacteria bacterium]